MKKIDIQTATGASLELSWNSDNYSEDLEQNDSGQTGIKTRSSFNSIPSVHVCRNFALDSMHDFPEGICRYHMVKIIPALTEGKLKKFDLETLNDRLLMFHYGPIDNSNKPPFIKKENLKA